MGLEFFYLKNIIEKKKGKDGAVSSRAMDPYGPTHTWEGPKFGPSVCFCY